MDEKELREAYAAVVKSGDRDALAELIVEYVDPQHITHDLVGMFLNTRTLKPGDALVKRVRRGVEVKQLVPGMDSLASQINLKDVVNYNLDGAYAEVSQNEWEVESGELGTADDIKQEMLAKLADYYITKVMNAFYTLAADVNDSVNFYYQSGVITRTVLEAAIKQIDDVAGSVRATVGRKTAVNPITNFGGYLLPVATEVASPTTGMGIQAVLEQIQKTGKIGQYYGSTIIPLDQIYDNDFDRNKLIQDDMIVVVGNKAGEFITYGDIKEDQWTVKKTVPPTWHVRIYQQFGLILDAMENVVIIRTDA